MVVSRSEKIRDLFFVPCFFFVIGRINEQLCRWLNESRYFHHGSLLGALGSACTRFILAVFDFISPHPFYVLRGPYFISTLCPRTRTYLSRSSYSFDGFKGRRGDKT